MCAIEAKTLKGFRDLLPQEMIARDKMISIIKETYESYGFVPLSTPAMEYKETLLCYGSEANKQIYLFKDPDGVDVGLRFDLTVPLSRVACQYNDIPMPFKRYQIEPVWRYDKPDPGRYREFVQFDIDIIGTKSMMADAEIISAMNDCLKRIGLNFRIRCSNRKILSSLIKYAEISEELSYDVFRIIDKLDKKGLDGVKEELKKPRVEGAGVPLGGSIEDFGAGLSDSQVERIDEFLSLPRKTRNEALDSIRKLFAGVEGSEEGIDELSEINDYITALGIPDENACIDFTIARGLAYYTGPVFEAILTDKKLQRFGSVMGGGRYDKLIERFTGTPTPATGASIGVDRLLAAIEKAKLIQPRKSTADVLITIMMRDRIVEYQKIARMLRENGINTEVYMGNQKSISKQLKYADRQMIPVALILGSDELDRGEISIKDLNFIRGETVEIADRKTWVEERMGQKTVPMSTLVDEVKKILAY